MLLLIDTFLQIKRGSAVSEEDHRRKEGGDQEDQPEQPGKIQCILRKPRDSPLLHEVLLCVLSLIIICSAQKERLRQKEANMSSPS